jgi:ubiquinone/menaquinone biosynthesis C-methylase UbiE
MDAFTDSEAFLEWEEGSYCTRVQQHVMEKVSAQFTSGQKVLEVGCGKSIYLPLAKESSIAVGMDICKNFLKLNKDFERVVGDAENLSFPFSSFDYVLCMGLLHHMPDKKNALNEIAKVCNSKIFILEPHSMSINWIYRGVRKIAIALFGFERVKKWVGFVTPHETFISKRFVEENLSDFQLKFTFYSPFRAPPLKALNRLNFEAVNDFLEKMPGIRRMGTYMVVEGERIRGNEA